MQKLKLGDIIEIKTAKGFAYAQYTHKHEVYGSLIRVFDKMYSKRPQFDDHFISQKVRFTTFLPLQSAVKRGIFEVVKSETIRTELIPFPTFRAGIIDPVTKKVNDWWLWDGKEEWKVGKLSEDQRRLPIRGVWNDTLLIQRIESDWRPETDLTT
jgi:hypothetical protein